MKYRITVIGGANVDIGGRSAAALVLHESNPGVNHQGFGGVGRNIAHNLCLLGEEVRLIAAFGDDLYGRALRENCRELGMDLRLSLVLPERRSSTYLYLCAEDGELLAAIADMDITRCLTPAVLERRLGDINASDAVVVDANLEEETLTWLAGHCTAPLYADPVSAAKAPRLLPILGKLRAIKPNRREAEILSGCTGAEESVSALLNAGVQRVFLTLGGDGLLAGEGQTRVTLPGEPDPVVNVTGAGDAVLAALVWADLRGYSLCDCARAGLRAGAVTAACEQANTPHLKDALQSFQRSS